MRPPPAIEDVRWIRVPWLPGGRAVTLRSTVLVRGKAPVSQRLERHEYEHVLQYHRLGTIRFLVRYVAEYLRSRRRRYGHQAAYRRISFEIQAEWRARRAVGVGVVRGPSSTIDIR